MKEAGIVAPNLSHPKLPSYPTSAAQIRYPDVWGWQIEVQGTGVSLRTNSVRTPLWIPDLRCACPA